MPIDRITAPKRLGVERRRHPSEEDPTAVRTLLGFAVVLLIGIGVAQVGQQYGWFEPEPSQGASIDNLFGAGGAQSGRLPARKMKTGELQQAEALPDEGFAKTVTLASDSDTCSSLRNDLAYSKQMVQKASGAPGSKLDGLKREVERIQSQGTRLGCWSGGPQ